MPSYISTLKDDDKTNNILPRTVLKAVADDNGSYLDSGLQASDINYLKNGKAQTIEQKVDNLVTQSITDGDTTHAPSGDAVNDALNAISDTVTGIGNRFYTLSDIDESTESGAIQAIMNILKTADILKGKTPILFGGLNINRYYYVGVGFGTSSYCSCIISSYDWTARVKINAGVVSYSDL